MMRLSQLSKEDRLTMIEETRWQFGQEYTQQAIADDYEVNSMCDWGKTLQGGHYWAWVTMGIDLQTTKQTSSI